jgi:inner membrane protein
MLLFAHTGITAGSAWLAGKAASLIKKDGIEPSKVTEKVTAADEIGPDGKINAISGKPSYSTGIDYRMVLIGSMLPDIIDKPLGIYLLADEIGNGRIYGHTLLFFLALVILGIFLYYYRRNAALLLVSAGTFVHLVLDQMWENPHTLFWPLFGAAFERHETEGWLPGLLESLTTNPSTYISEVFGALIIGIFAWHILRNKNLIGFLKTGHIHK